MHQQQTGPHRYYTRTRLGLEGDPGQIEEIPLDIMGDRNSGEPQREAVNNDDEEAENIMSGLVIGQQQVADVLQ